LPWKKRNAILVICRIKQRSQEMTEESYLKLSLDSANDKAKYDENVKSILSDKYILSWILKYCVEEYRECSIEEIYHCIEGTPQIGNISIMPGTTRLDKVLGMNTESEIPNEGKVTFDIIFYAVLPGTEEHTQIFINVEAQKDANPGYDLVLRGIFYCARMISAQMNTIISAENYAIRKVYSIWISMEEGVNANTIRSYTIKPEDIYGTYTGKEAYDAMSVVMVRLPKDENAASGNQLHKLLTTALSSRMTPKEKEDLLEHTYGIPMTYELKEATKRMCNLSDLVEERGIQKGIQKGIQEGAELKLIQLVVKKLKKSCTVAQIADQLEEVEERIAGIVTVAQKYAPEYDEKSILEELLQKKELL